MNRLLFPLLLIASVVSAQEPEQRVDPKMAALFPAQPEHRLTDLTGTIQNPDAIDSIMNVASTNAHMEIAAVVLPSIGDYPPNEVAMTIGRAWHVGNAGDIGNVERGHGAVILVVPKTATVHGQCFIAPAQHSQGYITDTDAEGICQDMISDFKNNDYRAGILTGVAKVAERGQKDYVERTTPHAPEPPSTPWPWGWILSILALVGIPSTILLARRQARRNREIAAANEAYYARIRAEEARREAEQLRFEKEQAERNRIAAEKEAARRAALTPQERAAEDAENARREAERQRLAAIAEAEAATRRAQEVEEEAERRRRDSSSSFGGSYGSSYDSGGSSGGSSDWGGGGGGSFDGGGGGGSW